MYPADGVWGYMSNGGIPYVSDIWINTYSSPKDDSQLGGTSSTNSLVTNGWLGYFFVRHHPHGDALGQPDLRSSFTFVVTTLDLLGVFM